MTQRAVPGLFVTGTDTGVGKTYVTACIARILRRAGLRVGVYKPVASGCVWRGEQWSSDDALVLWDAAGRLGDLDAVCPQRFAAPLAPPLAAAAEGRVVDAALLRAGLQPWLECADVVLVEGAGGLMSPVTESEFVADLAYDFGFPLLVVAPNALGVINQTLQTLITAAAFREGLDVAGIVLNNPGPALLNDVSVASNRRELARHCVPPILGELAWQADDFDAAVPWQTLAR
jgi:dethiobiotin synthetase